MYQSKSITSIDRYYRNTFQIHREPIRQVDLMHTHTVILVHQNAGDEKMNCNLHKKSEA